MPRPYTQASLLQHLPKGAGLIGANPHKTTNLKVHVVSFVVVSVVWSNVFVAASAFCDHLSPKYLNAVHPGLTARSWMSNGSYRLSMDSGDFFTEASWQHFLQSIWLSVAGTA